MSINLASKYSKKVSERWYRESQVAPALNNDYEFTGVETVKVYSIPVVAMSDYKRTGANRYGEPNNLARNVQTMTIKKDRGFTYTIDRGDHIQSEMVTEAGKSLSRQLREVVVPEFDTYVFKTLAAAAIERGNVDNTAITKSNAYEQFLKGMEWLGNRNVPDEGRVCYATYGFANQLKQDPAFMKSGDKAQGMVIKGEIGTCDGCKIVRVPANRLPAGAAFLLVHPSAATAPKQLNDHKIHDNPPGINGWLVEGRVVYDCFVLNEKADGLYYHGSQAVLKDLIVTTAATATGKSTILVTAEKEGAKRYYVTAATAGGLKAVAYGTAITPSEWTELTSNSMEITPTSSHLFVRVVEVDASNKPLAVGTNVLNIG